MLGGTYLVVRRHRGLDRPGTPCPSAEQEQIIGRDKHTGAPLGGTPRCSRSRPRRLPPDAHIRVAAPRTAASTLLRRGYDTDDGLLFLAFMNDPRRQYVPLQQRLAAHDALHPHTDTSAAPCSPSRPETCSSRNHFSN